MKAKKNSFKGKLLLESNESLKMMKMEARSSRNKISKILNEYDTMTQIGTRISLILKAKFKNFIFKDFQVLKKRKRNVMTMTMGKI